jgi:iron complex outermembrane receptor protein
MNRRIPATSLALTTLALAIAGTASQAQTPTLDPVQVTATREAEPVDSVPASITVVTDAELCARGAHDLRDALSLVAGVEISPGGDGGPAGSVPAMWGLREFDAFLLVIDGVPAGGAFNPQLTTLSLENVERIEVMRGSAPVMFGATSFVGVIQVIHYAAGHTAPRATVSAGTHGNYRASLSANLGDAQSISLEGERVGSSDPDANYRRGQLLYRAQAEIAGGTASFDFNASAVRQKPASPSPRDGATLDPMIPIDANYNPSDARLDEDRLQAVARFRHDTGIGEWATTMSYTRTFGHFTRGFLTEDYADTPVDNAMGFQQNRQMDDFYFDSHIETKASDSLSLTYGVDWLYGRARYANRLFAYTVGLDGSNRPDSDAQASLDEPAGADWRSFQGLYLQADWKASERFDVLAGIRLNHTSETIKGDDPDGGPGPIWASHDQSRLSGSLGASWHVWRDGEDALTLYADVRNTFKPAALDFGPEAEGELLLPESAVSEEIGVKGQFLDGKLDWDLSVFSMNFNNLVVAQTVDGLPGLVNAGKEHFKGAELEARYNLGSDLQLAGHVAYHDARFGDYVELFDDTPTQLRGRRLEMSPQNLGGLGLVYSPAQGWQGSLVINHIGDRFLNKRNTALAGGYNVVDASFGYRFPRCEIRLSGRNLGDRRDPIAESELGEGQYYRLPARLVELGLSCTP